MKLNFVKMNSQGNDFIIIDNTISQCNFTTSQVKKIASRDSIGCDQLLLLNIKNP
jgi:diaminopimelate epimerase